MFNNCALGQVLLYLYHYKQGHLLTACAFVVMGTHPLIQGVSGGILTFRRLTSTIVDVPHR